MKTLTLILILSYLLLAGCAEFVAGYQEGKRHRGEPGYVTKKWAEVGSALFHVADSVVTTGAEVAAVGAVAYADAAASYVPPPPSEYHNGAIFGPNGQTSLYNVGPTGGMIFGPNGQTTIISGN